MEPLEPFGQVLSEVSASSCAGPGNPTLPFHAEIVPSSVEKMKAAAPAKGAFSLNAPVTLATIPEGFDGPPPPGNGTMAANAVGPGPGNVPSPAYNAEIPVPLSLIQKAPPGTFALPQGFTSVGSS